MPTQRHRMDLFRSFTAVFVALVWSGCDGTEMAQEWQLDRLRILGAQATPAEPAPGQTVTFESLVFVPEGASLESLLWMACLPETLGEFGCTMEADPTEDLSEEELENLTQEELMELLAALQEAGFIGYEDGEGEGWEPEWSVPEDALDGLTDAEAFEGLNATVNLVAMPLGAEDEAEMELAFKRVPVSLSPTPNHNPEITALSVDDVVLEEDEVLTATAEQTYVIEPMIGDDDVEDYVYLNSDCEQEERTEEPYFTWYATTGSFDQTFSLYPYTSVEWTPDETAESGQIIVVVRDRRGGMAWSVLPIVVE